MEKKLKIVLVDDNTDYLFTMETFLKRNGFDVQTVDDGQKGLELIRNEPPNVVLLDETTTDVQVTVYKESGFEIPKSLAQCITTEIKTKTGSLSKVTIEIIPHQVHSTLQLDAPKSFL